MRKVVFLYTELANYFLVCLDTLNTLYPGTEIHVIHWPINKEAPFEFHLNATIYFYNKKEYSQNQLVELVQSINPQAIYCSGWIDKEYLTICKQYRKSIPVIVGIDNQWKGTLKQHIATIISPFKIKPYFSKAWVPGKRQRLYAQKLGFKNVDIEEGFYSADTPFFSNLYQENLLGKQQNFPKRFLFVGRYYDFKGINELWQAFVQLQQEQPNEWQLWCCGTGSIQPLQHPKIKHLGFVQPKDMPAIIQQTGVFILPSQFEPWGVVAHEYAAAGFPLLLSDKVGAGDLFLKENINGFTFPANNVEALKSAMLKVIQASPAQLLQMASESNVLAQQITPTTWANTFNSLIIS